MTLWLVTGCHVTVAQPFTAIMDSSPAGLFDSYDQDFKHIIQGIRDKLEGSGKPERGGIVFICAEEHGCQSVVTLQNNARRPCGGSK